VIGHPGPRRNRAGATLAVVLVRPLVISEEASAANVGHWTDRQWPKQRASAGLLTERLGLVRQVIADAQIQSQSGSSPPLILKESTELESGWGRSSGQVFLDGEALAQQIGRMPVRGVAVPCSREPKSAKLLRCYRTRRRAPERSSLYDPTRRSTPVFEAMASSGLDGEALSPVCTRVNIW